MNLSHVVIENAIPLALCRAAEAAWPDARWPYWHRYNGTTANKFGSMDRSRIPPACLAALDALAAAVVPHIGQAFVDYDLHAAGLHCAPPGGFLSRHLDAECHPIRPWKRTHSIVMSCNSEWNPTWGGDLRLEGDEDVLIPPQFGRAIIFETPGQWHEVTPVSQWSPHYRKTLALFAWRSDHDCSGSTGATFQRQ